MEVDIIFLGDFDIFNLFLNLINPPQEVSFMVIFSILDDTPGEVDSINQIIFGVEGPELKSVDFFHDIQSEVDQLIVGVFRFMVE